MGRYTKTFEDAVAYAKDLMKNKEPIDVAAEKAGELYREDAQRIIQKITTGRVPLEEREAAKKAKTIAQKKKKRKTANRKPSERQMQRVASNSSGDETYCYEGPVDILCLNHEIKQIILKEVVSASDKQHAKDKINEKILNSFMPIRIPSVNWSKYLKKEAGVV